MKRPLFFTLFFCIIILEISAQKKTYLERGNPEAEGISSEAILNFLNRAEKEIDALHSYMIVKNGKVISEGWWSPYNPDSPHQLYSLSKGFISTAIGFAVQEGLFSIDDIEKITQDNYGQRVIEAEKALNIIVLESQDALKSIYEKITKDKVQIKLESFLDKLSDEEIKRFKSAEDLKQMIMNLSIIKYEDKSLDEVLDIKNIDNHVIESMFKRYIDNA